MTKLFSTPFRLIIYTAIILFVAQQAALAQDHAAKIQEVLSLAHKYRQFNGSALVAENGRIIYKSSFGMANMEWDIPNAPDTRFRLGSITKQFTAMMTLQLVEQGKIKLDAKISDYLPDYRKDVGQKVTIHHLLTHTSGIPSYTGLPGFFDNVSRNPYKVADFVKQYASGDLQFEPGTKFAYNNSGYFLLGAIIERVTGKPYEQVLKENVLIPAGMKNTGYDRHDSLIWKRASGYSKTPDGGYINAAYLDMSIPYAAGSLYCTIEDLYLWDQALYTDKLLSASSKELMYKPFLENYAYGWAVTNASFKQNGQPVPVIKHDGGINGFSTIIVRFPGEKNLIVLLDNTSQNVNPLSETIAKILYNQPYDPPKMSIVSILEKTINEKGIGAGITQYRDLKAKQSAIFDFAEGELNDLGYRLLRAGKTGEAIEIFKLNVEAYPQGFNTYDSLGEAYIAVNDRELAVRNYKKSLELNPNNNNAAEVLKRLEKGPVVVDAKLFDTYVGEYEVGPGVVMRVFREGDKFMTQVTGQDKFEIFPESETTFSPRAFNAKLTFIKDAEGKVTGLRINQNGRETDGKRIN